jgi:O-antigen ligase
MHPSILSAYILLLAPAMLLAGATARRRVLRICGLVGAGTAYLGLAFTLSRWPWVMACVELALVAAALVVSGRWRLKRALGVGIVVLVAGLLALVPFREKFLQRLTGDFSRSVEFRAEMAQLAVDLWRDHPVFGVGLNHFTIELLKRQPEQEASFRFYEEMFGKGYRSPMVVHNLYLLILAETGLAGLAGFLFFVARMLSLAARAARQAEGPERAVCAGLLIGILGVLGHMISDFCLWLDPIFVVWFVLAAMLNGAATWNPLVWRQGFRPSAAANGG